MAFSIDHKGPRGRRFYFAVQRESDGKYWRASSGWVPAWVWNPLPEQTHGTYSTWMTATAPADRYAVTIYQQASNFVVRSYYCNSKGKKPKTRKGGTVNAAIVGGVLHVDGQPEEAGVVLESLSSNGFTKYMAVKWAPSGIATCNCPGWTTNTKHKGKSITERSCKHTKVVLTMTESVYLGNVGPQAPTPATGSVERSGRGVELD